tara:strand:- start:422 stop:727 length:306 start_codon:yes stop_codon:yes gene_type:complete
MGNILLHKNLMNIKKNEIGRKRRMSLLKADGLDACIIGTAWTGDEEVVVYDANKIVHLLIERDGMDYDEAWEFYSYNIERAYVGPKTPIYVHIGELDENNT